MNLGTVETNSFVWERLQPPPRRLGTPFSKGDTDEKQNEFLDTLYARTVVFRLLAFLAFYPHFGFVGTVAEVVRVVMRGCRPAFWTLKTVPFAVTARAVA